MRGITVGITLVPHWSTAGAERTIQREVILEVPEDFLLAKRTLMFLPVLSTSSEVLDLLAPRRMPLLILGSAASEMRRKNRFHKRLTNSSKQMAEDQVDPGFNHSNANATGFWLPRITARFASTRWLSTIRWLATTG